MVTVRNKKRFNATFLIGTKNNFLMTYLLNLRTKKLINTSRAFGDITV